MNSKKLFLLTILILSTVLPPTQVRADSEAPPFDYAIFTNDKKYIFVMLVPPKEKTQMVEVSREAPPHYPTVIYDSDEPWKNATLQDPDSLRIKYPCSGLYKNNGSSVPIWTVEWYSYSVYLFPDGEHLIRLGPWNIQEYENGQPSFNGLAFAFYKNGIEVAQYKVKDVVKDTSAILFSVSHYSWYKNQHIDKSSGLFYVETLDNQKHTYDVRKMAASTKGVESSCKPNYKYIPKFKRYLPINIAVVVLAGILGIIIILRLRKRN